MYTRGDIKRFNFGSIHFTAKMKDCVSPAIRVKPMDSQKNALAPGDGWITLEKTSMTNSQFFGLVSDKHIAFFQFELKPYCRTVEHSVGACNDSCLTMLNVHANGLKGDAMKPAGSGNMCSCGTPQGCVRPTEYN